MLKIEAKLTREGWRGIVRRPRKKTITTEPCKSFAAALAAAIEKARGK
jgi:hypothetical protein